MMLGDEREDTSIITTNVLCCPLLRVGESNLLAICLSTYLNDMVDKVNFKLFTPEIICF